MNAAANSLSSLSGVPFIVMDGAGNDFVVVDLRRGGEMTPGAAQCLGDRDGPFGCDQIITVEQDAALGARMGIWNADGSSAGACGNAARCVASLLMSEAAEDRIEFGSPSGPLHAAQVAEGLIEVDMGPARTAWSDIPVADEVPDTKALPLPADLLAQLGLNPPAGLSMGNPHAVFFVEDAETVDLEGVGPAIETHAFFPERVNVTVASPRPEGFRARTWERGVGITKACGTAACAVVVSAIRRGLTQDSAQVLADGGTLTISWQQAENRVLMAGPVRLHRRGTF